MLPSGLTHIRNEVGVEPRLSDPRNPDGETLTWVVGELEPGSVWTTTFTAHCESRGTVRVRATVDTVPRVLDLADNADDTATVCTREGQNPRSHLELEITGPVNVTGDPPRLDEVLVFEVTTRNVIDVPRGTAISSQLTSRIDPPSPGSPTAPGFAHGNLDPDRAPLWRDGVITWKTDTLVAGAIRVDTVALIVDAPNCDPNADIVVELPVTVGATRRLLNDSLDAFVTTTVIDTVPRCVPPRPVDVGIDLWIGSIRGDKSATVGVGQPVSFWIRSENTRDTAAAGVRSHVVWQGPWDYRRGSIETPSTMRVRGRVGGSDTASTSPARTFVAREVAEDFVTLLAPASLGTDRSREYRFIATIVTTDNDADSSNNADTVWVTVIDGPPVNIPPGRDSLPPDLSVRIDTVATSCCQVDLRLTVKNDTLGAAENVRLTFRHDADIDVSELGAGVTVGDTLVAWSLGDLASGDSTSVTLRLDCPPGSDMRTLVAAVTSDTPEPNLRNNRATTVVIIQDTIRLDSCGPSNCSLCSWLPGPDWWCLLLLLIPLILWGLYRRRRYGGIFVPCFRLFTMFRTKKIRDISAELREPKNKVLSSVRQIHDRIADQPCQDWKLTEELMYAYRDVRSWTHVYNLWENAPPALKRKKKIRRIYAFALNRDERSEDAEFELRKLIEDKGADAHTLGVLGRVYKDRWERAYQCAVRDDCDDADADRPTQHPGPLPPQKDEPAGLAAVVDELRDYAEEQSESAEATADLAATEDADGDSAGSSAEASRLLELAISTYRRGHAADPTNPYPGLNALTLSQFLESPPTWYSSLMSDVQRQRPGTAPGGPIGPTPRGWNSPYWLGTPRRPPPTSIVPSTRVGWRWSSRPRRATCG